MTLDADVERLLKQSMHRSRRSFKETLNNAIRVGLGHKRATPERPVFVVKARPMGLRAGIDPSSFNKLADELDAEGFRGR